MSVTAIIVNTNDGRKLADVIDLIRPEVSAIVVVDNGSTDGSLVPVERAGAARIVRNGRNIGFAAAVNRGATDAVSEWLLLVNPDAHPEPGDITRLLAELPADVAAVGPLQVNALGRALAETGGYEPTVWRYLVWAIVPWRFHRGFGPWLAPPLPERDAEVEWMAGTLLGIRRQVFERLAGFDERFFLYMEDVDFGRRARASGHRVWLRPAVRLHHEVAHGDPQRRARQGVLGIRSLAIWFGGWRRRMLGGVLLLGFSLRALVSRGGAEVLGRAAIPSCIELIHGRVPPLQ